MALSFEDLVRVLNAFEIGVAFCRRENGDRQVHTNAAFRQLLLKDPARAKLEEALESMLADACPDVSGNSGARGSAGQVVVRDVRTARATYRLRGAKLGIVDEPPGVTVALVTVEPLPVDPLHADVLRHRYRLTQREVELTRLLVTGMTNAEVARALGISPNTAHHYTERVLLKLGVRNRTEIGAKLLLSRSYEV